MMATALRRCPGGLEKCNQLQSPQDPDIELVSSQQEISSDNDEAATANNQYKGQFGRQYISPQDMASSTITTLRYKLDLADKELEKLRSKNEYLKDELAGELYTVICLKDDLAEQVLGPHYAFNPDGKEIIMDTELREELVRAELERGKTEFKFNELAWELFEMKQAYEEERDRAIAAEQKAKRIEEQFNAYMMAD